MPAQRPKGSKCNFFHLWKFFTSYSFDAPSPARKYHSQGRIFSHFCSCYLLFTGIESQFHIIFTKELLGLFSHEYSFRTMPLITRFDKEEQLLLFDIIISQELPLKESNIVIRIMSTTVKYQNRHQKYHAFLTARSWNYFDGNESTKIF